MATDREILRPLLTVKTILVPTSATVSSMAIPFTYLTSSWTSAVQFGCVWLARSLLRHLARIAQPAAATMIAVFLLSSSTFTYTR